MGQEALKSMPVTTSMTSNSAAVIVMLIKRQYVPLITFYNKTKTTATPSSTFSFFDASSKMTEQLQEIDQNSQEFKSSVEERKQSVHSFRVLDSQQNTDADKDLIIHSLHESLHIHKEILERIQNEKEAYQQHVTMERQQEQDHMQNYQQETQDRLEQQLKQISELENSIVTLKQELDSKKEEYSKLEVNFYSYVKTIRVTDDDLSTIQPEIAHLLSQLNNTLMGLKSKMNRKAGNNFVFQQYNERAQDIKKYMLKEGEELLDTSFVTLFIEKYLLNVLLTRTVDVPVHIGISINDAFKEIDDWMSSRNKEWSTRIRQQICSLVVQKPGDEEDAILQAKNDLLEHIVDSLKDVYPSLLNDSKKIENLITRALKLNLALKGQEIKIERVAIEEGVTEFDSTLMKATAKGRPNGIVFLSITPPFIARDEIDNEHGFTVPGKVFCIEQLEVEQEEDARMTTSDNEIDNDVDVQEDQAKTESTAVTEQAVEEEEQ